ncbi:hypothetical protein D9M69_581630 [compost metagenome]
MRSHTITIPHHLASEALLYAARGDVEASVCHVLQDYPRLVSEVRKLRRRVEQLDQEGADFDARLEALQDACRAILDL